jgi:hypothetical protein
MIIYWLYRILIGPVWEIVRRWPLQVALTLAVFFAFGLAIEIIDPPTEPMIYRTSSFPPIQDTLKMIEDLPTPAPTCDPTFSNPLPIGCQP